MTTHTARMVRCGVAAAAAGALVSSVAASGASTAPELIAYSEARFGGLCLARPDGTRAFRVTATAEDGQPAFSPDGRLLAFSGRGRWRDSYHREEDGWARPLLYVAGVRGQPPRRFPGLRRNRDVDLYEERDPAWSPDGRSLAYAELSIGDDKIGDEDWRMMVLDVASGRARAVAEGYVGSDDLHDPRVRARLALGALTDPAWSPDGRTIAFTSRPGNEHEPMDRGTALIRIVAAGGGASRVLVEDGSQQAWSPDGTRLAYVDSRGDVVVAAADGSDPRPLAVTPAPESAPAWSPDGTRLAYARRLGRGGAIVVSRPDGSEARIVARSDLPLHDPAWAPAGARPSTRPCVREGTPRADLLRGTPLDDAIVGHGGYDRLLGGAGRDVLVGGFGADAIDGGDGHDVLRGGPGRDTLAGGRGDDRVEGGDGADVVDGGPGHDILYGGRGRDRISGGSGNDYIGAADGERDIVSCGPGRDGVSADRIDVVARDCEVVDRP